MKLPKVRFLCKDDDNLLGSDILGSFEPSVCHLLFFVMSVVLVFSVCYVLYVYR